MIVYRITDRIPIQIGDVTFWVSPLSFEQRNQIAGLATMRGGVENIDNLKVVSAVLKYSLKEVQGLKTASGDDYALEVQNNELSDECLGDLLQLSCAEKLMIAASQLAAQIKEHKIDGVKIDLKQVKSVKKTPLVSS